MTIRATCTLHSVYRVGCENCRLRAAERQRARTRAIAYGTLRRLMPPADASARVRDLHDRHGMSIRAIAAATGVATTVVTRLLEGTDVPIRPSTHDRIMAVQADAIQPARVSSLGAARMLQALAAIGHSVDKLAAELGVSAGEVTRLRRRHRPEIAADRDRAIRDVYQRLQGTSGGCDKTAAHARQQGWAPPLAWEEDEDLDRPEVTPSHVTQDLAPLAVAGKVDAQRLSPDERLRVVEYLTALRWPDRRIAEHLRWHGGRDWVAKYRCRMGLTPGTFRGDRRTDAAVFTDRQTRFRLLKPTERLEALQRFNFPDEAAESVAFALGCDPATVRRFRRDQAGGDVDQALISAALAGAVPFSQLSEPNRLELFREHGTRLGNGELGRTLHISGKTVVKYRQRAETSGAAAA